MGVGILEAVQEEGNLEDAHIHVLALQEKLRKQARISFVWKNMYKNENLLVTKLKNEKEKYLQSMESQLFAFEGHLKRGRAELDAIVKHKDRIIHRQHQLICSLVLALIKKDGYEELNKLLPGLKLERKNSEAKTEPKVSETIKNIKNEENKGDKEDEVIISTKGEYESLNDSDSAIMMEDAYDSLIALPSSKGEIKVMRSVSDALEIISRGVSSSLNNKPNSSCQSRRIGHGSLSSTPSCSSEESDESPTSTITKDQIITSNDSIVSESILRLDKICLGLSPSAFIPYKSSDYGSLKSNISCPSMVDTNSNTLSKKNHCCSRDFCESPSCWQGLSSSTTPIGSPLDTPTISPIPTPIDSPRLSISSVSISPVPNCNCDYDSDVTLSDYVPEEHLNNKNTNKYNEGSKENYTNNNRNYENIDHKNLSHKASTPYSSFRKETIQITYNRVMSNHRSVTKPKDVKYKRINKAKSRSLEELRGKLKLSGGKQAFSLDLDNTSDA